MWKDIPGYEGKYQAHWDGAIRSLGPKARVLKLTDMKGYLRVKLCGKPYLVHRLVALTFIRNPENKPHINHKNGVKTDNWVENLEWVTISENIKHAFRLGLRVPPNNVGESHSQVKLKESEVQEIRYLRKTYNTPYKSMAVYYGVTIATIGDIIHRNSWDHLPMKDVCDKFEKQGYDKWLQEVEKLSKEIMGK